jgi:hypothetical protein
MRGWLPASAASTVRKILGLLVVSGVQFHTLDQRELIPTAWQPGLILTTQSLVKLAKIQTAC